jgi:hypothetical protein
LESVSFVYLATCHLSIESVRCLLTNCSSVSHIQSQRQTGAIGINLRPVPASTRQQCYLIRAGEETKNTYILSQYSASAMSTVSIEFDPTRKHLRPIPASRVSYFQFVIESAQTKKQKILTYLSPRIAALAMVHRQHRFALGKENLRPAKHGFGSALPIDAVSVRCYVWVTDTCC